VSIVAIVFGEADPPFFGRCRRHACRYNAVNAMLLNEFLKEHRKVEKLEAALRAVNARLAEQDAKIQKVSAQLQLSQSRPQTVLNGQ
jgi:hypothetical protein